VAGAAFLAFDKGISQRKHIRHISGSQCSSKNLFSIRKEGLGANYQLLVLHGKEVIIIIKLKGKVSIFLNICGTLS
jgi:hypothetical protein